MSTLAEEMMPLPNSVRVALRVIFMRARPDTQIRGWSSLLSITALLCAIDAVASFADVYPAHFEFNPAALVGIGLPIATFLVVSVAASLFTASPDSVRSWFLSMLAGWAMIHAISLGVAAMFDRINLHWMRWGFNRYLAILWILVAAVVLVLRQHQGQRMRAWLAAPVIAAMIGLPLVFVPQYESFFEPRYDEADRPHFGLSEEVLYAQGDRLKATTDEIQPGQAATLFFVGVAPSDQNTVFAKEIQSVKTLFETKYHTLHHEAVLINSRVDNGAPLASRTALRTVLTRIGSVMDPVRDVLFLYITSHGSEQEGVAVASGVLELSDLSPTVLRQLLDQAGIRRRVIVISACHAGVYLPALQDPNTIAIAAAAAGKSSFGCSNSLDYTYFGQAYFVQALSKTSSFEDAFNIARPLISAREKAEGFDASDPQMVVGAAASQYLREVDFSGPPLCTVGSAACPSTP